MTGWITLGCSNSGNCPQTRRLPDGSMLVRSSRRPGEVARLDPGEWDALVHAIRDGETDQTSEAAW